LKTGRGPAGLSNYGSIEVGHPEVIPLPAAGWLLLGGFAGLAALKRRRRTA
jgi:hypothetical protein